MMRWTQKFQKKYIFLNIVM